MELSASVLSASGYLAESALRKPYNTCFVYTKFGIPSILDNLGIHHCKPVNAWLAANRNKMAVCYLPNYSPQLNPEERLNADLKHVIPSKVPVRTKAKLQAVALEHMAVLQTKPERTKSFFQATFVKYVA